MAGLWIGPLSRNSLTLIIRIISIKRHCSPINPYAVMILRIKLLHLFDTGTHLSSNHLPRHLFTHYSRLYPAIHHRPRMWPAPKRMKTAPTIPTLHLFNRPVCHWLLLILVGSEIFSDGFEAGEVEIDGVAVDWDTCIRSDMDVVVSVTCVGEGVLEGHLAVRWHLLTWKYVLVLFVVVLY
jgi:hypothetical protein